MSNDKHYPLHPNATHPPIMTCEIPLEEYESLKRENERLNRELEHVKNGDCIYTCDVVEKHVKEELKAKRALWIARAERASEKADTFITFKVTYNGLCNINNNVWPEKGAKRMLECEDWLDIWTHVWDLCTKKAEEYK